MSQGGATTISGGQDIYQTGPQTPGPHLPPWVPPPQDPNAGRSDINNTSMEHSRRYASVSAEGTLLPIIYGEDYIGPIITLAKVVGNYLYLRCVWCLGEIQEIVKVVSQEGDLPAGTTMTHYLGTVDQPVDPSLAAVIPGYNDNCVVQVAGQKVGVAYSVIKVPAAASQGFPRLVARIKGRVVRDPRGYNFYPNSVDGDFTYFVTPRIQIGYNGTGHSYNGNHRAINANAFVNSAQSKATITFTFRDTGSPSNSSIFDIGNGKFRVYVDTDGTLRVTGKNAANTTVLDMKSTVVVNDSFTKGHAIVISFDLTASKAKIWVDKLDVTNALTITGGQTINVDAAGWAIGGDYATSGNQINADLSGISVAFGRFDDLTVPATLPTFFDDQKRLLKQSYTADLVGWDGRVFATGLTYPALTAAVLSDSGSKWVIQGSSNYQRYVYPGVNGGLYYYYSGTGSALQLMVNSSAPTLPTGCNVRVYGHITDCAGSNSVEIWGVASLFTLSDAVPENVFETNTGDTFDTFGFIKLSQPSSGPAFSCVLRQFYVFPAPETWVSTDFNVGLSQSNKWIKNSGTGFVADTLRRGILSAAYDMQWGSINNVANPGETVDWYIEIDGTFTGSVTFYLQYNGSPTLVATEPGAYTGRGVVTNPRIVINCSSGQAIVWKVQTVANTVFRKWTQTPSLFLADMIESSIYGLGADCNDSWMLKATNYNEELIGTTTEKRHQAGITLAQQQSIESWIEALRGYARCFIAISHGEYLLIPDKPATAPFDEVGISAMVQGSFKVNKKSLLNLPNVIKIFYTSTAVEPWTEDSVEIVHPNVLSGVEFRRESTLRMSGIQSKSMATRYATERLNFSTLLDLEGSFQAPDSEWKRDIGDVINITHPIGLVSKSVRVLSCEPAARGIVNITFIEYDANAYSDVIVSEPPPPDYGGQTPFNPPQVTGLALTESFYVTGNTTKSQLNASWADPLYAFVQYYQVDIYENGTKVYNTRTPDRSLVFRDLVVGATYMVTIKIITTAFVGGLQASSTYVAQGKNLPPDFSAGQIVAFEVGDGISAYVRQNALDIDLWGYEWRYREVTQNNLYANGGPGWNSGSWTIVTQDAGATFTMAYKKFEIVTQPSKNLRITSPITGLVAGRTYDVYVKVNTTPSLNPNSAVNALFITMPGGTYNASQQGYNVVIDTRYKAGVYKFSYTPTSSDLSGTPVVTVYSFINEAGASNNYFEVEYIAVRENQASIINDWNTANFVERSAAQNIRIEQVPSGCYVVYCRALDSVRSPTNPYGQYSTVCKTSNVNVISDAGSFFRYNYRFSLGTLTREGLFPKPSKTAYSFTDPVSGSQVLVGTLVPDAGSTFAALFTSPLNTYANPIASYSKSASLTHVYESGTYDLGTLIKGSVNINFSAFKITDEVANITWNLLYKTNIGDAWTVVSAQLNSPTNFSGRYIGVRATIAANKSTGIVCDLNSYLDVTAIPRVETGIVTSLGPDGSGNPQPKTITLNNIYTNVISARAWVSTTESIEAYIDNITFGATVTTFTIVALNLRGQPVAATVNWEFKGV